MFFKLFSAAPFRITSFFVLVIDFGKAGLSDVLELEYAIAER